MTNEQQRLEFAAKFAQTDLKALREGDWLNLKSDLGLFLHPLFGLTQLKALVNAFEVSNEEVEQIQQETYALLAGLISEGEEREKWRPVTIYPTLRKVSGFGMGCKTVRDAFYFRLCWLLVGSSTERLLHCKADDCNRLFYRTHRQQYCSPRCQTRDFMRKWRKDNEEKESELNHKKYKRRVEKTRGRPTKVARRGKR